MRYLSALICVVAVLVVGGCNGYETNARYTTEERLANGLVIILPGIEGESPLNRDIRRGLVRGGIDSALPIYHWGRPIPGIGMLLNQMDFVGNRIEGVKIAKKIQDYQEMHPGRKVYLVGHSGGGGVAVFAAEAMPEGKQIDGLILLSASIWERYDLTKALSRTRYGIANFYNEEDIGLLGIGTTIMSNVDGMRGPSAGLNGFTLPKDSDSDQKKLAYKKLRQVRITRGMSGGDDPHSAATRPGFVSMYIVPLINARTWAGSVRRFRAIAPDETEGLASLQSR